jgi:hypothetical protein
MFARLLMHRVAFGSLFAVVASATLAAQLGGKPVSGGNPTPGTAQPPPPNLADRITVTGCLRRAPEKSNAVTTESPAGAAAVESSDANVVSDDRFVLANAGRIAAVPPDTGGSSLARSAPAPTYRLEGLDSQFSPFLEMKVEVSGELKPRVTGSPGVSPTLLVEFVQKVASRC